MTSDKRLYPLSWIFLSMDILRPKGLIDVVLVGKVTAGCAVEP